MRARRATCDENLQSSPHWYPLVVAVQAWENFLEDRRDAAVDMTKRKPKRGILHVQEWIDTIGFVKIFVDDLISRLHSGTLPDGRIRALFRSAHLFWVENQGILLFLKMNDKFIHDKISNNKKYRCI